VASGYNLGAWNDETLWKCGYEEETAHYLFFAEDLFGEQFALRDERVHRFDPETAAMREVANDLEEWAKRLLSDYKVETGWPLAHEWQQQKGPLPSGMRLVPIIPFALGGEFKLEKLQVLDAVKGMQLRADIWPQTRHLPDGTKVQFKIT